MEPLEPAESLDLSFNSHLNQLSQEHLKELQDLDKNVVKKVRAKKVRAKQVWDMNPIFTQLAKEIHVTNEEKGFWGDPEWMDKIAGKLALVHSEVTEVLEALRKSQGPVAVTEEFADIFIRCLDLHDVLVAHGEASPDLFQTILMKAAANRDRPPKHGNRWG